MSRNSYRVTVVVDTQFGDRLRDISVEEPVWIADSAENHLVIKELWDERKAKYPSGITSFKFDAKATSEDWLLSLIADIDLHHGNFSHNPPWSILNVIGARWSQRVAEELAQFGFTQHVETKLGFEATKQT
jgi:hypothetical protein